MGSGEALAVPSCPLRPSGAPQRGAGRSPAAFSRHRITLSEASVILCRFFPFPIPRTKSVGVKCFGVSQIRDFGACKPASWAVTKIQTLPVVRVSRTTGREGKKQGMGALPPNPLENKRFKTLPAARVPRATGREGKKKSMGAIRPQTPNQEQSSWTSSVGSPHIGHDTSWRHPSGPKTSWAVTIFSHMSNMR